MDRVGPVELDAAAIDGPGAEDAEDAVGEVQHADRRPCGSSPSSSSLGAGGGSAAGGGLKASGRRRGSSSAYVAR